MCLKVSVYTMHEVCDSLLFLLFLIFASDEIGLIMKNVTEFFCLFIKEVGIFGGCRECNHYHGIWGQEAKESERSLP